MRPSAKSTKLAKAQQRAAGEREAAKIVLLHHVGAKVCSNLNAFAFPDPGGDLAATFLAGLLASAQPRDMIEEMLVVQMAFTHARLAYLSRLAADQEQRVNITAVNQACEQASNTFRRQMLALSDYRRVPKAKVFAPIRNANIAQQQLVQQVQPHDQLPDFSNAAASNEQGFAGTAAPPALSAECKRLGGPAGGGAAEPAVGAQHGAADTGGQGAVARQRAEARPSIGKNCRRVPRS